MALPVAAWWLSTKTFLLNAKLWVCVALAVALAIYSFQKGKTSCQEKAYEALEDEIERINDRAAKAVKQAAKDARVLNKEKETGNALVEKAKAAATGNCALDPNQLSILQDIQGRTTDQ